MKNGLGPIVRVGESITILVLLNLVWIITVILGCGVTVGAATTAAYTVMRKRADKEKDEVMIHTCFSIYWKALKENFKESTIVWIITLVLGTMLVANIRFSLISSESLALVLKALQIIILIQLVFINIYCYSMISNFEADIKRIMYSALLIANAHLFTTLTCVVIAAALLFTVKMFNFLPVFILISSYVAVTSFIFKPIFKKYSRGEI
ncbi:MAG: DUF624 domain-containing protein [Clostridium sp.]|uniref:DUF624 domain-containing protein n=1 Tax=Clostridium paraputrificum TaxID=29363 RepID=A0A6N3CRM2_9CLOT|nr:DUF624 domain-containing protein [Clostridium sp.]MBS5926414.1 DUF624 domain-containing protein [Clostridium sp.]MBS5987552.1 DUF624 domain-containing protein [Clostridium sp.]